MSSSLSYPPKNPILCAQSDILITPVTTYCSVLLNPATKSDLLAACIQADAALKAGLVQAQAITSAGYWTFAAGVFAVLAAALGGILTLMAAQRQIRAARDQQSRQRTHDLKSNVYVAAVRALATGLQVIVRLADMSIRPEEVFRPYDERMADLFGVHIVADVETAEKFLNCVRSLGALHMQLNSQRPFRPEGGYTKEELLDWARCCSAAPSHVLTSMTVAVAAMRAELGQPVDAGEYERLLRASLEETLAENERLFERIQNA